MAPKTSESRPVNPPEISLTPFSQMLYDSTSPQYSYPTPAPETPSPPATQHRSASHNTKSVSNHRPSFQTHKSPSRPKAQHVDRVMSNTIAHDENSSITVQIPVKVKKMKSQVMTPQKPTPVRKASSIAVEITPYNHEIPVSFQSLVQPPSLTITHPVSKITAQPLTPAKSTLKTPSEPHTPAAQSKIHSTAQISESGSQLAVVIPGPSPALRREDYEIIPDSPETPQHLSKNQRRSGVGSGDELSVSLGQREKADLAVRNLRDQLQDIFEAEATTSDGTNLSASTQTKVESALKDAESIDLKVGEAMGESEVEGWLQNVSVAELGVKAARTILRMMLGGRDDKQLYSEDATQAALNTFKNAIESCLIPIVEMRSSGSTANLFKLLLAQKKVITGLLTQCRRLLSLFATLVAGIELSETVVNTLEFIASRLIFVENAHAEKDSVLGIARFDSLRVVALDTITQIFLNNPLQRQGIFDEILTSLEKLPVTKQSARQFKLSEGGSIQLVSALIMRLVQTSSTKADDAKETRRGKAMEAFNGEEGAVAKEDLASIVSIIQSEARAEQQVVTAIQELRDIVSPLLDTAKANASYVVGFIVQRAMNSTKAGDTPYRNLLDLFMEDFILCLNSPEWPAAELLLRLLLFKMVHLAEGDKTPAPAKNMALDLLGSMGAAISDLISHVRKTASSLINDDADLGRYLSRQAEVSLEKKVQPLEVVSWACGPFRTSLEFLDERRSLDPQLSSAVGLFMAEWASKICTTYDLLDDDGESMEAEREYGRLAYRLRMMIGDKRWLSTEYSFNSVNAAHARLAYSLTLLQSQFCESFARVLMILLGSMASEQATVRSRSLKSVTTVLETDPTILDREPKVMQILLRCSNDSSVLVRDSALALIGKCMSLRPSLENDMVPSILQRITDSGVGVRKRALKLSKDVYLRNTNSDIRSLIADSLLHRVTDQDESVQELARQTIEEVWMSPFYQPTSANDVSAQYKLAMASHVSLMVKTVQRGGSVSAVLDKVLQSILSDNAKFAAANFKVCKALVATMFETIIDNATNIGNNTPSARDALQVLTIFAKSNAKLFTPEQVQLLQPYVSNVAGSDDLAIYRSVVVIFRHVLPHLSKAHNSFLASVRKELMPSISRMGKAILDDLVACLWIISEVLDDFQHLTRLVLSSLIGIQKMKAQDLNDPRSLEMVRKLNKLLLISGMCGKHCDLDRQIETFRSSFPKWKEHSVSALMTHIFAPFASPEQPLDVRKAALEAIGMVSQSWPKNLGSPEVWSQFLAAFEEQDDEKRFPLETISMKAFKDFLLLEEKRSETGADGVVGMAADATAKLGVMGGGQGDGIAIALAQRFHQSIIKIALSRQDEQALLATEIIGCIIRQGLMHPKECTTALVALETSQNPKIAEIAFREHRAAIEKHESILEKEYMRSVQLAYSYQRDVVKDTHGATLNPFAPKLHMLIEILKMSKPKNRKKFFENLCARIDFDPEKIDLADLPGHLDFSQFIIENMAFLEYVSVDELLSAITAMEGVVSGTGTSIAHAIETEILHIGIDQQSLISENGQPQPMEPEIDEARLQKLTASSMMLSCLWEARTYLRRQYGLLNNRRESKGKAIIKDLNRPPVKAQGINGDKFWEEISTAMAAFDSKESMIKQCRSFVELLSVDQDFKLAAEGDEDGIRMGTPSDDEENETPGPPGGSGRGRKRKALGTPSGRKKRARSSSVPRARGRPKGSGRKGERFSVEPIGEDDDLWV
ncbi:scc2 [Hyphodiscus hymeniophilus]|uniref:Sister chromatid cohesion protein n=1 Tax=Hyphodiscus hymeniophilus TaxID=353542 RepID=A0A9P6VRN9_9HELO|nr:scc2 [Hyphodiscus hymeniophilus]